MSRTVPSLRHWYGGTSRGRRPQARAELTNLEGPSFAASLLHYAAPLGQALGAVVRRPLLIALLVREL